MIAELMARRTLRRFFRAFEAKDVEGLVANWREGAVLRFPDGLPIAGEWRGLGEIRSLFQAVFAHNARMEIEMRDVAVARAWSPTGRMRVYCEWSVVETGIDGHVVRTDVLSVSETERWRAVRSRDWFSNIPGMAEHYAGMPVPARASDRPVAGGPRPEARAG